MYETTRLGNLPHCRIQSIDQQLPVGYPFAVSTDRRRLQSDRVNLTEAAQRFGVSRRTLERWVRDGRLAATPGAKDARERLVDPKDVAILVRQMPKRSTQPTHSTEQSISGPAANRVAESADESTVSGPEASPGGMYPDAIDGALQMVYSQYHRLIAQLDPDSFRELTLEHLREGPLGRDLRRISRLALGQAREPKELVQSAVDSVLQLLFWPAAAEDYTVPRAFWDTDFGRMLAQANYRAYDPKDLVSIGAAAELLGVNRPTIYRWMDDRTLNYVRDDASGRTFVVRRDVENLKKVATELVAMGMLERS